MAVATKNRNTRYLELRDALRRFIVSNPPGTCLPSYAEMIRQYGVHQSTIDRAMREFDEEKLIVREHGRGMFISPRAAQRNIGIVFGRNVFDAGVSPINQIMLRYAEKRSSAYTENASFFIDVPQVPVEAYGIRVCRDLLDAMEARRFDGVLLLVVRGPREISWLADYDIPVVVCSGVLAEGCRAIGLEAGISDGVARLGTGALARQGCRRIAMVSMAGHKRDQGYWEDLDAYREVLAQHRLEARPEWVWDRAPKPPEDSSSQPLSNEMIGYRAACELFGDGESLAVDGLVCTDDMAMRGVLARLRELDIVPGRDLKIATHVNRGVPVLLGYESQLTRIEADSEAVANQAFGLLDRLMAGERLPGGTVVRVENGLRELPSGSQ